MQKYKNPRSRTAKLLLTAIVAFSFAVFGVAQTLTGASQKAFADTTCPAGYTYSSLYRTCTGPESGNNTCPSGSQLSTAIPPPNNCVPGSSTSSTKAPALKLANPEPGAGKYTCGSGSDAVQVSINFGCTGKGTATTDATFAIIRVLSAGVGLVVITSIVVAGIQYTTSRGDPNATAKAITRIRNSLYALLIYIFAAGMLDFIIPKGFFK